MTHRCAVALAALALALPAMSHAQDTMPGMDMGGHQHHHAPAPPRNRRRISQQRLPLRLRRGERRTQGHRPVPGSAEPPPVAHDLAGSRYWDPQAMAQAHHAMMTERPAPLYGAVKMDIAEYQFGKNGDSWRWEGEGWLGDTNRLWVRSRGEGPVGGRLEDAEVEAAYSRAISPWWNLQAGVRQDLGTGPVRTHAMLALEGLAPYRFETLAAAYLSDKGQWTGRIEASVDERVTRRIVLQPRVEFNLSAQDMPQQRLGAGLTTAELGFRLRYEFSRKFAPYLGVSWTWAGGRTADYRRADGESPSARVFVLGLKSWF
jgi:copper resistance protein B